MEKFLIIDSKGVIWSSSSPDAEKQGRALMEAVQLGCKKQFVRKHLGDSWDGDLVLVKELARTR